MIPVSRPITFVGPEGTTNLNGYPEVLSLPGGLTPRGPVVASWVSSRGALAAVLRLGVGALQCAATRPRSPPPGPRGSSGVLGSARCALVHSEAHETEAHESSGVRARLPRPHRPRSHR